MWLQLNWTKGNLTTNSTDPPSVTTYPALRVRAYQSRLHHQWVSSWQTDYSHLQTDYQVVSLPQGPFTLKVHATAACLAHCDDILARPTREQPVLKKTNSTDWLERWAAWRVDQLWTTGSQTVWSRAVSSPCGSLAPGWACTPPKSGWTHTFLFAAAARLLLRTGMWRPALQLDTFFFLSELACFLLDRPRYRHSALRPPAQYRAADRGKNTFSVKAPSCTCLTGSRVSVGNPQRHGLKM